MKSMYFGAAALLFSCLPAEAEAPVPDSELASLQAAMQTHIDQSLVDGALLQLDEKTGKVRPLYPAKAHPMIESLGKYFYLCANFRDEQGTEVMVNFFAAKDHDKYVVFHTTFEENKKLESLIEQNAD